MIAPSGGTKVRDIVTISRPPHPLPLSEVYRVPCGGCESVYLGETGRSFKVRETEHRRDIVADRSSNAFVQHRDRVGHLPRWTDAKVVAKGLPRHKRKMVEAAFIANESLVTNVMSCSYRLSLVPAALVAAEVKHV